MPYCGGARFLLNNCAVAAAGLRKMAAAASIGKIRKFGSRV
jgi:hypothetical protein